MDLKKAAVLGVLLVLLTGCSSENRELERGMELRSRLLKAGGCRFGAEITADYGDRLYTFSADCQGDARGDVAFTVTAPETISGITGTVSETGGRLTFDDTALHFPIMADDQVTPVTAPWLFLKTLRGGYLRLAGMEDNLLRLTIDDSYEDEALQLDIWVNESDQPVRAEILYDGRTVLSLNVKNFEIL